MARVALLSVRWAQLGGPGSGEEKAIVAVQAIAGALCGWEYYKHKMYVGLGCLWAAPAATVAALF